MWRNLFRDVVEAQTPLPELDHRERQKYWVAIVLLVLFLSIGSALGLAIAAFFEMWVHDGLDYAIEPTSWMTPRADHGQDSSGLVAIISGICIGAALAWVAWQRLFVSSGYLSRASIARLSSNRAPTEKGERNRVMIGYVVYLSITWGVGLVMFVKGSGSLEFFTGVGLTAIGVFYAAHAFLRYRKR